PQGVLAPPTRPVLTLCSGTGPCASSPTVCNPTTTPTTSGFGSGSASVTMACRLTRTTSSTGQAESARARRSQERRENALADTWSNWTRSHLLDPLGRWLQAVGFEQVRRGVDPGFKEPRRGPTDRRRSGTG